MGIVLKVALGLGWILSWDWVGFYFGLVRWLGNVLGLCFVCYVASSLAGEGSIWIAEVGCFGGLV